MAALLCIIEADGRCAALTARKMRPDGKATGELTSLKRAPVILRHYRPNLQRDSGMRTIPMAAALLLTLAACATHGGAGQPSPAAASFESEGRDLAMRRCGACHATDLSSSSPRPGAPPFRQLRIRFNQISWERVMAEIGAGGHDEMPRVKLTEDEVRRLKNYVDSLRGPALN